MVDLQRYRVTSGEKNFKEQIKAAIFLELVLAIEIMQEPQSNLEEKVKPSILKDYFFLRADPSIHFHLNSTSVFRLVRQNYLSFPSIKSTSPFLP